MRAIVVVVYCCCCKKRKDHAGKMGGMDVEQQQKKMPGAEGDGTAPKKVDEENKEDMKKEKVEDAKQPAPPSVQGDEDDGVGLAGTVDVRFFWLNFSNLNFLFRLVISMRTWINSIREEAKQPVGVARRSAPAASTPLPRSTNTRNNQELRYATYFLRIIIISLSIWECIFVFYIIALCVFPMICVLSKRQELYIEMCFLVNLFVFLKWYSHILFSIIHRFKF